MMIMPSNDGSGIVHFWAGRYPGSVGWLIGPRGYKNPKPWMPFALDNDAFTAWRNGEAWDVEAWRGLLQKIRFSRLQPLWAAVPDVVANREATIENWKQYAHEVQALAWSTAFCVQDGMTPDDVPDDADIVFVGGSDRWKFPNLKMWTSNFPRVHCGRVNSQAMIEACELLGCESVDGTGWFRSGDREDHVPMLKRFIEGHRSYKEQFELITTNHD